MDWKPAKRKRTLTADEAELWAYTMRDARALRRRERSKQQGARPQDAQAEVQPQSVANAKKPAVPAKPPVFVTEPPSPASRMPPLAAFDDKDRRRLSKSPDLIDARLDLHGMRQREAHSALRSFLFSAVTRGHRHVLIITGKGVMAERDRDFFREERGVLRRLVPQWLGEPEMRGIVISYTASHVRHGGDGALYVKLRRARG